MNTQCEESSFLRKTLIGNALFSSISGLALILGQRWISRILGLSENVNLLIVGIALIAFAASLVVNARRQQVKTSDAWIAVWLDVAWVLGSYVLIFIAPFSTGGKWIVGVVAELVLLFAALQFIGIRKIQRTAQFS